MRHLITLSIGPVQGFIAAARRTSDLTAGSVMLLEVCSAAAQAVKSHQGSLIFPESVETSGANKILAELPDNVDPKIVAIDVKKALQQYLLHKWEQTKPRLTKCYDVDYDLAAAQLEVFFEVYAAWIPFDEKDYADKRARVDQLLAARKNLRDFRPAPDGLAPVNISAKSPLDPSYECVLKAVPAQKAADETDASVKDRNPLHIKKTEFLDAISLIKRADGIDMGNVPSTRVMAQRHKTEGYTCPNLEDDEQQPDYSYFAILQADGDNMGIHLSGFKTPDEHRQFSKKLAQFAESAKRTVKGYDGYPVYAGGDDVLAFLPVGKSIACAVALADEFQRCIGGNLSAGIAVVHYKQPLSLSRKAAVEAEKQAKAVAGKNSLCLSIHTRGGTPLIISQPWGAWKDFERWTTAYTDKKLTRGLPYELKILAEEFSKVNVPKDLLLSEAVRIWNHKQAENREKIAFPVEKASSPDVLLDFTKLLRAARFLTNTGDN